MCEVTNQNGRLTDTLKYDAYGKVSEHQGESVLIFTYNGRDGVLTDPNGLLYMRARYYCPDAKRFISLDIIEGSIADSSTLNRYAYVNGNPISFVDPFGLSAERGESLNSDLHNLLSSGRIIRNPWSELDYPGEVHRAVVLYLSDKYGLKYEYVPKNNPHHRYDLYSLECNTFWEVKPVSYIPDGLRREAMIEQMENYQRDGVDRGLPLGLDEIPYKDYKIKIYSVLPGKVYYSFQYDTAVVESPEPVYEKSKEESFTTEWSLPDPVTVGVIAVAGGAIITLAGVIFGTPPLVEEGMMMVQNAG